jgi:hypothetical protein
VVVAARVADGPASRTKIIANPRVSPANLAGKFASCRDPESYFAVRARCVGPHSSQGEAMPTTFQKRQKEMKRNEKRKMKEEKRAQRKLEKIANKESGQHGPEVAEPVTGDEEDE